MEQAYTYIMSDTHGQNDAFIKMLKRTNFKSKDILYVIGKEISNDIVDKLSDGMIIGLLKEWNMNGGGATLQELLNYDNDTINNTFS